ncbi:MAG: ABC transporter ATP-binding protein [Candidatus Polarisedimenticolaceae bacterium]|nr:ABC transporter ATP-binding protein [Candidatus Polarisedimenticolaceae bacterium]
MNLLSANSLRYSYAQQCVVNNVSISLKRGEIVGLLGQNGAGKSTCLRMISGNLCPTEGEIFVAGHNLLKEPQLAKQKIGYLPDEPPLYGDLWVDEYLTYCAQLHQIPRNAVTAAVTRVKRQCELNSCGRKLIGQLSKGYRQRLGIAQALIHQPDLIVLDEPTIGLDPIQIHELRDLIRELGSQHGIILSSHILPEVESLCQRVEILHHGEILHSEALQQPDSKMLDIQLAEPPTLERLQQLSCIETIEPLEERHFLLQPAQGVTPQEIASQLVGWGVQTLSPQQKSLEQIFIQLTSGEVKE